MPQDIRVSPDGKVFYVADMMADGVYLIDGDSFKQIGFIKTAWARMACIQAAMAPSFTSPIVAPTRYTGRATDRGSRRSVIDFATRKVVANWPIPGGGSPGHGQRHRRRQMVVAIGSFRRRRVCLRHRTGKVKQQVGYEPHGLADAGSPDRVIRWVTRASCVDALRG